jgi:hypothetical protein
MTRGKWLSSRQIIEEFHFYFEFLPAKSRGSISIFYFEFLPAKSSGSISILNFFPPNRGVDFSGKVLAGNEEHQASS